MKKEKSKILNKLLASFVESNPGPVMRFNAKLKCEMNNSASDILYNPCAGEHLFKLIPGLEKRKEFFNWFNQKNNIDTAFYHDFSRREMTFRFTFMKVDDGFIHLYGANITELKRVERLRDDTERIIRHDLRTPLNGIVGFSQLLLDDVTLSKQQREMAYIINTSGYELLEMINHSLDLFQMEERSYVLNPKKFNFIKTLNIIDHNCINIKKQNNLETIYYLSGKIISWSQIYVIVGEEIHITSLFTNLIINALEASPKNSKVTVSINPNDKNHNICVHNYGIIPEDIRMRFFERYATSGKTGGLGIGTYSALLIAKIHNGDITFTSSREKGTDINVSIPKKMAI